VIDCAQPPDTVGAVRHAVPPALGIGITAIVAHGFQVARGRIDQLLAFFHREPGLDAVRTGHFGETQSRERLPETVGIRLRQPSAILRRV
jgi:hypothetical protein